MTIRCLRKEGKTDKGFRELQAESDEQDERIHVIFFLTFWSRAVEMSDESAADPLGRTHFGFALNPL